MLRVLFKTSKCLALSIICVLINLWASFKLHCDIHTRSSSEVGWKHYSYSSATCFSYFLRSNSSMSMLTTVFLSAKKCLFVHLCCPVGFTAESELKSKYIALYPWVFLWNCCLHFLAGEPTVVEIYAKNYQPKVSLGIPCLRIVS